MACKRFSSSTDKPQRTINNLPISTQDLISKTKLVVSLRPLEFDIPKFASSTANNNIKMTHAVNPPNIEPKVQSVQSTKSSLSNGKIIRLNTPFIKLVSLSSHASRNQTQSSVIISGNRNRVAQSPILHSKSSSHDRNKNFEALKSLNSKKGFRIVPSRLCKGRSKAIIEESRKNFSNSNRTKKKIGRRGPSRASIRLYEKLKKAKAAVAKMPKRPCLLVHRTVELVDQTKNSWRKEKSKLLFVLSLGLTPKPNFAGFPQPVINVTPADPAEVLKITERYKLLKLQQLRLERAKVRANQEKLLRLAKFSQTPQFQRNPILPGLVEVIDLASDEDEEKSTSSFNLPNRPNIQFNLVKLVSKPHSLPAITSSSFPIPSSSNSNRSVINPAISILPKMVDTNYASKSIPIQNKGFANLTKPRLVKQVKLLNEEQLKKQMTMRRTIPQHISKTCTPLKNSLQRVSNHGSIKRIPMKENAPIYAVASPPMQLSKKDIVPVSKIIEQLSKSKGFPTPNGARRTSLGMPANLGAYQSAEEVIIID